MNRQMIIASLKARPVRTTVGVLAVALQVILMLVILGLTTGISTETGKRTEGVGADILLQAPNSSLILALSQSTMALSYGDKLRQFDGIKAVAPVFTLVNQGAGLEIVYGIEPESFDAMNEGFVWQKGGIFKGPDDLVVDDIYAQAKRVKVGDRVELLNHTFTVTGVVEHGKGARLFVPLKTAQEMAGQADKASLFFIKVKDPQQVKAIIAELGKALPTYKITDVKEYTTMMMSNNMAALDAFISTVVFISLCIGVLVIFLSMYTTITERTREIGILRSMGASKGFIMSLIFQESATICLIGTVVGIGSSFLIRTVIQSIFPTLMVMITADWIAKAAMFAILSGLIGSFYPALKAAAQDPVEALAYE
jgi:putative ABC transport system permease protein